MQTDLNRRVSPWSLITQINDESYQLLPIYLQQIILDDPTYCGSSQEFRWDHVVNCSLGSTCFKGGAGRVSVLAREQKEGRNYWRYKTGATLPSDISILIIAVFVPDFCIQDIYREWIGTPWQARVLEAVA